MNAGVSGCLHQRPYGAQNRFLILPGRLIHKGRRRIFWIASLHQLFFQPFQQTGGKEKHHGRPVGGKGANLLFRRHLRPALHSRNHDALRKTGKGIFQMQGGSGPAKRADAGRHIVRNPLFVQKIHLLSDCPVQRRISCMQTNRFFSFFPGSAHHLYHLFQGHLCAIVYLRLFFSIP